MGHEGIPLWDGGTHPLSGALDFAFGCHHAKPSRVFTIEGRSYKVCWDGGEHFEYSWRSMSIVPQHQKLFLRFGGCAPGASTGEEACAAQ